jgi:putative endonuclease
MLRPQVTQHDKGAGVVLRRSQRAWPEVIGGLWPTGLIQVTMSDMATDNQFYVYIMTNKSGMLYTGMTNNIKKRADEHKNKLVEGFTKKYNIDRLLYFETFGDVPSAIAGEKTIKGWLRIKKLDLIRTVNPDWRDLSEDWY